MRFETESTYTISNNFCLSFLWYMLSCFLYILFFIAIYLFYLFAGCPYEFVKCYLERKNDKENENEHKSNFDSIEIYEDNINESGIASRNMRKSSANQNNINNNSNELKEKIRIKIVNIY